MRIALRTGATIDDDTRCSFTRTAPPAEAANSHGRHSALTLFTPIRRRWVWLVRFALWVSKWLPMTQKHILQFKFIHMVRWSVVKNDALNDAYLFFESDFDGPWQQYIDGFAYVIPRDIRFLWGRGYDFPAPPPGGAAEAMDRHEQHGRRHLLQRLSVRLDEDGARRARHPSRGSRALRPRARRSVLRSSRLATSSSSSRYRRTCERPRPQQDRYGLRTDGVHADRARARGGGSRHDRAPAARRRWAVLAPRATPLRASADLRPSRPPGRRRSAPIACE